MIVRLSFTLSLLSVQFIQTPFLSFVPITLGFQVLENRTTRCVTCMRICSDRTLKSSVQLPLASIRPIQILGYIIQCITSSVTVRTLTVPVPSLDKGGGRR